jgi:hypothetical protein
VEVLYGPDSRYEKLTSEELTRTTDHAPDIEVTHDLLLDLKDQFQGSQGW